MCLLQWRIPRIAEWAVVRDERYAGVQALYDVARAHRLRIEERTTQTAYVVAEQYEPNPRSVRATSND